MKIFAISDLHLSGAVDKPMDVFGDGWQNHFEKISVNWRQKVGEGDVVLLGGDMSWGMNIDEAAVDYDAVAALPGRKIVIKGNHDFYWNSLAKIRKRFVGFDFLQNDAIRISCGEKGAVIAGSRGWNIPSEGDVEDAKIFNRELIRLKLSLDCARRIMHKGDEIIALLHFPPFGADLADTAVTQILEEYGVKYALYGHLHGKNVRVVTRFCRRGTEYILTSCDLVGFDLVDVCEL